MKKSTLMIFKVMVIVGLLFAVTAIGTFIGIDWGLNKRETVRFTDPYGNKLVGKYYPGTQDAGIMLFHGFGEDQTSMKSYTSEFHAIGFHVFTCDFSGHGRSPGILTSGNNETDRLANQVISAKIEFKSISGLTDSEIVLLGHSMGGSVITQAASFDSDNVAGLILLGASINLENTHQNGNNATQQDWVKNLGTDSPPVDILIITGSWEDVLPPSAAYLLYEKLANETAEGNSARTTTPEGNIRELLIINILIHNYEVFSPKAIAKAKNWSSEILGFSSEVYNAPKAVVRIIFWLIGILGLFLTVIFGALWVKSYSHDETLPAAENESILEPHGNNSSVEEVTENNSAPEIAVTSIEKFLGMKILLWLGALLIAVLVAMLFIVIPLGVPIFCLVYVGPITGYGLLMMILYGIGKVPGSEGKWRPNLRLAKDEINWKRMTAAIFVSISLVIITAIYFCSGLYHIFPMNIRLFWLVIFTIFAAVGFYFIQLETQIIKQAHLGKGKLILFYVIFLTPFFFGVAYFGSINSILYFIEGLHGLVILVFVLTSGEIVQQLGKNSLLTAIFQAFLLHWLVLPRGPLLPGVSWLFGY